MSGAYDINLLIKKQKTAADKVLYFLLHYFRYIIIITQIVVIGVFFYRFRQDQMIINMKEEYRQKQQILNVAEGIIAEAKTIETKAVTARQIIDRQNTFLSTYSYVVANVPADVSLDVIDMSKDKIFISGRSQLTTSIRSFHSRLKTRPDFANAVIDTIDKASQGGYRFEISVIPKHE